MANIHDHGMPFTSISGDRSYNSTDWREYFRMLIESGIIGDVADELKVAERSPTSAKTVQVLPGAVILRGVIRIWEAPAVVGPFADNVSGDTRTDRIVVRLSLPERKIELAILQGIPGEGASALTRNTDVFEMSLAQVELGDGYSTITSSQITDEREDLDLCTYFRYRAKPAWYPESGLVSRDAWVYTNFKDQLSQQEIEAIEENPTLLAIIHSHYASQSQAEIGNDDSKTMTAKRVLQAIRYQRPLLPLNVDLENLSDVFISTNETMTKTVNVYRNLTIDSGVTLTGRSGVSILFIEDTLTLNGTIDAVGRGAAGGSSHTGAGNGGNGGGVVLVFAGKIVGAGSILANGENGIQAGSSTSSANEAGNDGTSGSIMKGSLAGGSRLGSSSQAGIPEAVIADAALKVSYVELSDNGGAGGGGGYYRGSSTFLCYAPNGGNGVGGSGGRGRTGDVGSRNGTSGGGGGGGAILIISRRPVPAIQLQATGGDGGPPQTSYTHAHGPGGGGGGRISILAPSQSVVVSVSGGQPGNARGTNGETGDPGDPGIVEFFALN